ncbi:MAG: 50S ribosomal protein L25/general stress protein Ctc [Pseudomonadota bacterium]|nr:50S ribosomal protein L25/general stress protein Ctc [Pseudomonadota bacterium]
MSNTINTLTCSSKKQSGTIASKKIRSQEQNEIPAIIYGEQYPNEMVKLPEKEINLLHERKKLNGHLFNLLIDGKKQAVLVKQIQTHFLKKTVTHIDFQRVSKKHKITTSVPILFTNADESPAIKSKGQITYTTTEVSIHCLPTNLPEHIELDLSTLELDQIIHLSELKLPTGVEMTETITEEHNPTLVTAHLPKIAEEPVEETEETTEGESGSSDTESNEIENREESSESK